MDIVIQQKKTGFYYTGDFADIPVFSLDINSAKVFTIDSAAVVVISKRLNTIIPGGCSMIEKEV